VFFITRWFANFRNSTDSDNWAIVSIITFLFFLTGLLFYFFSKTSSFRKIAFFLTLFSLLISVTTLAFSNHQKQRLVNRDRAIVFSPSVTVRSAPEASGTELFVIHEGTKVKILQRINTWLEVELQDGSIGWMHEEHLEII
ncbi:MAG: SH3 domain-containing protein, partial [Bacteroidales bacterium]|nr:SH3 domain-containing protein [Bacteroidales bacterium]